LATVEIVDAGVINKAVGILYTVGVHGFKGSMLWVQNSEQIKDL
jgi:hypothetical protein